MFCIDLAELGMLSSLIWIFRGGIQVLWVIRAWCGFLELLFGVGSLEPGVGVGSWSHRGGSLGPDIGVGSLVQVDSGVGFHCTILHHTQNRN